TDSLRVTEMFRESGEEILTHTLHHSRTKCSIKTINFVWSIGNFWNICNFMDVLTSSNVKGQSYKIDMCISREDNKLYFFISNTVSNPKEQINIHRYNIYIQGTEGAVLCTDWKGFDINPDPLYAPPLYEVCLPTLQLNETKYLPNNTLSVHFMFESYENIVHVNIYENIINLHQVTAATNDFVSDESDSIVTFVVEGNRLCVNKSLACVASPVFNKMLKKHRDAEKEIEIKDITFNIFKIIIHHINNRGILKMNFDGCNDTYKNMFLLALFAGAQRFDINDLKVTCEKHLIESITKENAIRFLDIAIKNKALYLANYVKRFIKLYIDDLRCTTRFLNKMQINPEILYDINKQELSEENAVYIKYNSD
ncbi:Ankyrin repeat and BTB/POZ domain-containing protein BTBD11-A, partial [Trachymyrmex cornetzi]